jgi:hypothetical protein
MDDADRPTRIRSRTWARVVGMALAVLSAIANFIFLPYYPVWAIVIIALDVAVIWSSGEVLAAGRHRHLGMRRLKPGRPPASPRALPTHAGHGTPGSVRLETGDCREQSALLIGLVDPLRDLLCVGARVERGAVLAQALLARGELLAQLVAAAFSVPLACAPIAQAKGNAPPDGAKRLTNSPRHIQDASGKADFTVYLQGLPRLELQPRRQESGRTSRGWPQASAYSHWWSSERYAQHGKEAQ